MKKITTQRFTSKLEVFRDSGYGAAIQTTVLAEPKHSCAARVRTRGWQGGGGQNVNQRSCLSLCVVKLHPSLYTVQRLSLIETDIYLHVIYSRFHIINGLY